MSGNQNLTRLNVALTATTGAFATGMKHAEHVAEQFGEKLKEKLLHPLTLIAEALAVRELVNKLREAIGRIDEMAKAADRLGISTQAFGGLQIAAERSGVSTDALTTSLTKMEQKLGEAAAGNREVEKTLKTIGIRFEEIATLAPDEQFARIAAGINGLHSSAVKTAATIAIFGRGGGPMLNLFSANVEEARHEAEALGIALSRADAAKVEEAHVALKSIGTVFDGIFNRLAVQLAPIIAAIGQAFVNAAVDANGFSGAVTHVVDGLVWVAKRFADIGQAISIAWNAGEVGAMDVAEGLMNVADAAVQAAQWIGAKLSAAWDLVVASFKVMDRSLDVAWAALRVPVADFTQFVASQLSAMLRAASEAIMRLKPEMGAALQGAADQIAASTGALGADARKQLEAQTARLNDASADVAAATQALFAPVVAEGSAALQELAEQYRLQGQKINDQLNAKTAAGPASEAVQDAVDQVQAEAQVRAEGRAAEIAAAQATGQSLALIEANSLKTREELNREYWDTLTGMTERQRQQAVAGTSQMFANLATLQQSHSKKARAIGKAAAKAKIVMDTASAAMGAYSAMASIPYVGPYLGVLAAAAAVAAGAIQLGNVDRSDSGSIGGATSSAAASAPTGGGQQAPRQTLILQGNTFSSEQLVQVFDEARERGFIIEGVRRG